MHDLIGLFLIWFVVILIVSVPVTVIIILSYWIPRKYGRKKLGTILSRVLAFGYILWVLSFVFEDFLFFKYNANNHLDRHNIELIDDYTIISNSNSGIRDFSHKFELLISDKDKTRIMNQIKNSEDFFTDPKNDFFLPNEIGRYSKKKVTANYENKWSLKRESYETFRQGYAPCFEIVSIPKDENKLIFEQIYD